MGYLDIQSREDIDGLIEKTLSAYFQTTVRVGNTYHKHSFILNPRINSIVYDKPSVAVKRMVRRGHAVQRNRMLYWASQVYLRLAFSKCGWFGCKYITFETLPEHSEDIYIMPGNMKLKIFDLSQHTVTSLLKEGFQSKALDKESAVRLRPQWTFIPPLVLETGNRCREPILEGCTLDRLPRGEQNAADIKVRRILWTIQQKNRETVCGTDYAQKLYQQIVSHIDLLQCEAGVKSALNSVASYLAQRVRGDITVAFSHGDFQKGNLFAHKDGNVYVLDWDTHDKRSLGYDILTYFYSFRYRSDYWMRIDSFLQDAEWASFASCYYEKPADKTKVLSVYLLEDILWTLQECLVTPEQRPSQGVLRYAEPIFEHELRKRLG